MFVDGAHALCTAQAHPSFMGKGSSKLAGFMHGSLVSVAHMKILIILLNKIVQLRLLNIFCGIFYAEFGGVIHFAVEVWSWK